MPRWLPLVAVILVGGLVGLGGFTFIYAKGHSYLSNDPEVCGNCHIMTEHLDAWNKSSHKSVATCNDCHTPHTLMRKYAVKAKNGFWHSFYFTTGTYPDPLRITEANHEVTEEACRYCHTAITDAIEHPATAAHTAAPDTDPLTCTRCHRYVGHRVR
ncbi:MAG: cytochrome c nitrite reductase small subunit [Longimicrobiales bacterium]|nr:cytochrome c nitrite reductase small subunit [Longimicrobiales bacterium]